MLLATDAAVRVLFVSGLGAVAKAKPQMQSDREIIRTWDAAHFETLLHFCLHPLKAFQNSLQESITLVNFADTLT